jgi:hypothetical protein
VARLLSSTGPSSVIASSLRWWVDKRFAPTQDVIPSWRVLAGRVGGRENETSEHDDQERAAERRPRTGRRKPSAGSRSLSDISSLAALARIGVAHRLRFAATPPRPFSPPGVPADQPMRRRLVNPCPGGLKGRGLSASRPLRLRGCRVAEPANPTPPLLCRTLRPFERGAGVVDPPREFLVGLGPADEQPLVRVCQLRGRPEPDGLDLVGRLRRSVDAAAVDGVGDVFRVVPDCANVRASNSTRSSGATDSVVSSSCSRARRSRRGPRSPRPSPGGPPQVAVGDFHGQHRVAVEDGQPCGRDRVVEDGPVAGVAVVARRRVDRRQFGPPTGAVLGRHVGRAPSTPKDGESVPPGCVEQDHTVLMADVEHTWHEKEPPWARG